MGYYFTFTEYYIMDINLDLYLDLESGHIMMTGYVFLFNFIRSYT